MTVSIALVIFSSIGLISCLYMITYFLFIKKENRLIEVKSTYTYNCLLDKNIAKKEGSIKQGYKFEFLHPRKIKKTH